MRNMSHRSASESRGSDRMPLHQPQKSIGQISTFRVDRSDFGMQSGLPGGYENEVSFIAMTSLMNVSKIPTWDWSWLTDSETREGSHFNGRHFSSLDLYQNLHGCIFLLIQVGSCDLYLGGVLETIGRQHGRQNHRILSLRKCMTARC